MQERNKGTENIFQTLPAELQEEIQHFLSARELFMFSLTSKYCMSMTVDNDHMWKMFITKEYGDPDMIMKRANRFLSKVGSQYETYKSLYYGLSLLRKEEKMVQLRYKKEGKSLTVEICDDYVLALSNLDCYTLLYQYFQRTKEMQVADVYFLVENAVRALNKAPLLIFTINDIADIQTIKNVACKHMSILMSQKIEALSDMETFSKAKPLLDQFEFLVNNSDFIFELKGMPIIKKAVEVVDRCRKTPLVTLVEQDFKNENLRKHLLNILIKAEADLNFIYGGVTPFLLAFEKRNSAIMDILGRNGAEVINSGVELDQVNYILSYHKKWETQEMLSEEEKKQIPTFVPLKKYLEEVMLESSMKKNAINHNQFEMPHFKVEELLLDDSDMQAYDIDVSDSYSSDDAMELESPAKKPRRNF